MGEQALDKGKNLSLTFLLTHAYSAMSHINFHTNKAHLCKANGTPPKHEKLSFPCMRQASLSLILTNMRSAAFLHNNRGGYQRVKFPVCGPGQTNTHKWQTDVLSLNHCADLPSPTGLCLVFNKCCMIHAHCRVKSVCCDYRCK